MTGRERRMSPRKACSMSMRLRMWPAPVRAGVARTVMSGASIASEMKANIAEMRQFEGETINISELGFTSSRTTL